MSKATYIINRALHLNLAGLKERLGQVHAITGRARPAILMDMLFCGIRYEAGYIDYTIFGMYDMTPAQRKDILTRGKNTRYVSALNRREDWHYFNHKSEFLHLFRQECGRDFLDLNHATADDFAAFTARHAQIIVKPEDGLCGKGVEKLIPAQEGSAHQLYNRLKMNRQTLVEEALSQHEAVSRLYAGSINTVRLVTMTDDGGVPHLLYAALRMGSGGAVVDNFNHGGMVIPVDPEKGTLTGVAVNKSGEAFSAHPDTETVFDGYPLPDWEVCRALVFSAATKVPGIRLVGWDLALTPQGPVLVEGNHFPGHDIYQLVPQNPEKKGMLPVFEAVVPYSAVKKRKKH